MNNYLILIIVGGVGVLLGMYFGQCRARVWKEKYESKNLIASQTKEKRENLEKILEFLKEKERIQNNDVEELCGVSHATAERYLDELEKEGEITQRGDIGTGVFYTLK